MNCEHVQEKLGLFLDHELTESDWQAVDEHLQTCLVCSFELASMRTIVAEIASTPDVPVPEELWPAIERRLGAAPPRLRVSPVSRPKQRWVARFRRAAPALAALIVLAVGIGLVETMLSGSRAEAATVNFSVLLDALPLDAEKAFRKFLVLYDARETTRAAAKRDASHLNFEIPETLPGGFRLRSVFQLRIGGQVGIAAAFDRHGEFLGTVFHPPMKYERYGSHKSYPCVIGDHCGHKVQVGEWKLVHVTDPTTCHCVLSKLDEQTDLPAVLSAVAPGSGGHGANHRH